MTIKQIDFKTSECNNYVIDEYRIDFSEIINSPASKKHKAMLVDYNMEKIRKEINKYSDNFKKSVIELIVKLYKGHNDNPSATFDVKFHEEEFTAHILYKNNNMVSIKFNIHRSSFFVWMHHEENKDEEYGIDCTYLDILVKYETVAKLGNIFRIKNIPGNPVYQSFYQWKNAVIGWHYFDFNRQSHNFNFEN